MKKKLAEFSNVKLKQKNRILGKYWQKCVLLEIPLEALSVLCTECTSQNLAILWSCFVLLSTVKFHNQS